MRRWRARPPGRPSPARRSAGTRQLRRRTPRIPPARRRRGASMPGGGTRSGRGLRRGGGRGRRAGLPVRRRARPRPAPGRRQPRRWRRRRARTRQQLPLGQIRGVDGQLRTGAGGMQGSCSPTLAERCHAARGPSRVHVNVRRNHPASCPRSDGAAREPRRRLFADALCPCYRTGNLRVSPLPLRRPRRVEPPRWPEVGSGWRGCGARCGQPARPSRLAAGGSQRRHLSTERP